MCGICGEIDFRRNGIRVEAIQTDVRCLGAPGTG